MNTKLRAAQDRRESALLRAKYLSSKMSKVLKRAEKGGRMLRTSECRDFDRWYDQQNELIAKIKKLDQELERLDGERSRPSLGPWARSLRPALLHEAAHAVVGVVCGLRVREIEFDYRNGRPTGTARVHFKHRRRKRFPPIVSLAGPVAEEWGRPNPSDLRLRQQLREGASGDWREAKFEIASADGSPGHPRTIGAAWAETAATLRKNWGAVEAVADAIAEAHGGRLSGERVHKICARHRVEWCPGQTR